MLVLTRRTRETLVIHGDDISEPLKINILSIAGGQVKIGIEAPKEISVDRQEVYEKKKKGNLQK